MNIQKWLIVIAIFMLASAVLNSLHVLSWWSAMLLIVVELFGLYMMVHTQEKK